MNPEIMNKKLSSQELRILTRDKFLTPQALEESLSICKFLPDKDNWKNFIDKLLLFLGTGFFLAGVVFFFAYNWAEIPKILKFGIIQFLIVGNVFFAWYKGLNTLTGKVFLLGASILVGVLLAVFGQVYQTGADAYNLFLAWSILIVGWVFISKFAGLCFFWLLLVNITIKLFFDQAMKVEEALICEILFFVNFTALIIWEYFAYKGKEWLQNRYFPRLIKLFTGITIIIPVFFLIFEKEKSLFTHLSIFLYALFLILVYWYYKTITRDLFMLTIGCFGLIAVITAAIGKFIDLMDGGWLALSILVIVLIGGATSWLLRVKKSWEN